MESDPESHDGEKRDKLWKMSEELLGIEFGQVEWWLYVYYSAVDGVNQPHMYNASSRRLHKGSPISSAPGLTDHTQVSLLQRRLHHLNNNLSQKNSYIGL